MKIKRSKKTIYEESSAASDIAFLLIIYFIVIAGFNVNMGFIMNLPAKDSTRLILSDELLRFELDNDGMILHEGEILTISQARTLIQSGLNINPNVAVIITIDEHARWQSVVSFVELVQDLRVDSFSFSMKKGNL